MKFIDIDSNMSNGVTARGGQSRHSGYTMLPHETRATRDGGDAR